MSKNFDQNVLNLENNILNLENKIYEYSQKKDNQKLKKSTEQLKSDLKYLAILTNGVKLNKVEYKKKWIILRVDYNFLQNKLSHSNI